MGRRYIATVRGAREIGLHGTADAAYWSRHLAPLGLEPVDEDGRVQATLTGISGSWIGIPFKDVSLVIAARMAGGDARTLGYFLARAFNASRFVAFFERHWFKTPYDHRKDLHAELGDDTSVRVGSESSPLLHFHRDAPLHADVTDETWEGPLYLPSTKDPDAPAYFLVKLTGATRTAPYNADLDTLHIDATNPDPMFEALRDGGFVPEQWACREAATHARGKTLTTRIVQG